MCVFLAWLAYLSISIMLGTLSATLYAAGKEGDNVTKWIAGSYGAIAFATLIYGYVVFQKRLTLISKRSGEHFGMYEADILSVVPAFATDVRSTRSRSDEIVFPILISVAVFIAIATNFTIRALEFR